MPPKATHELSWRFTSAPEDDGEDAPVMAAGQCSCGARHLAVVHRDPGELRSGVWARCSLAMQTSHERHQREDVEREQEHGHGKHNARRQAGCRSCAAGLVAERCRCWEDAAAHGPHCELMTVACCGACAGEERELEAHEWAGRPGPESGRVECTGCGYVANGAIPRGAMLCDGGRYLEHVHQLHRGRSAPRRRCAVCGGCWLCATTRFSLPVPGVCIGAVECRPEPQCETCGGPVADSLSAFCEPCTAAHQRALSEAEATIRRATQVRGQRHARERKRASAPA